MNSEQLRYILDISIMEQCKAIMLKELPTSASNVNIDILIAYTEKHHKDLNSMIKRFKLYLKNTGRSSIEYRGKYGAF